MNQQQTSLRVLSNYMKPLGVYVIEDVETSYYKNFGGGEIDKKGTTIDLIKQLIDVINRDFTKGHYTRLKRRRRNVEKYTVIANDNKINSIRIYPNCCVLYYGYFEFLEEFNKGKYT